MAWKEEFPDFDGDADCASLIGGGWEDVSWHNDTCPSFECSGVVIWVDYVDPMLREYPDAPGRFAVMTRHNDAVIGEYLTLAGAVLAAEEVEP